MFFDIPSFLYNLYLAVLCQNDAQVGGIGVANPVETSNREYDTSLSVTSQLRSLIKDQELTLDTYITM